MTLEALYKDIYARLTAHEALSALLNGEKVYDFEPGPETPGPYIVIGDTHETEGRAISDDERQIHVRLHIWSSYRGRKEAIDIERETEAAMSGKRDDKGEYLFESFQLLRDEEWTQGIVVFRTYIERDEA